jgi:hypothetical protein
LKKIVFLLVFATFFACKSTKKAIKTPIIQEATHAVSSDAELLKKIENNAMMPDWFSSKSSISASMGGNELDVDAVIQIRKDSAILFVIKKFGFEGARVLITPDSVFLINRLEQSYDKMSLQTLAQRFNMPPQFDAIQQLLVGNPTKLDKNKAFSLTQKDSTVQISTTKDKLSVDYAFAKKDLILRQAFFEDENSAAKMTMNFEKYKATASKKEFSYQRKIDFFSPQSSNGEIEINFSDVEFNVAKTMRFQIPAHYQRKAFLK